VTYLITGANTGIGLATARALARTDGARLYLACRSREKGEAAVAAIKEETSAKDVFLLDRDLDLASLDSVRSCAAAFLALDEPLHVLINNAGIGGGRGTTRDGFESHFGINHLGHFALTLALLERMDAGSRIVNVSSDAHYNAKGIDWDALRRPTPGITGMGAYAVSKLCNVLFTQELARRFPSTRSYALHPGVVASDIWRRVPWPIRPLIKMRMIPNDRGALTSVYCATSPEVAGQTGLFYDKCEVRAPSPVATPELGRDLWERSQGWIT
jgi:retinol dehydrogenase 12